MKQISLSILLTLLMSMAGIKAYAYDIAVENADGVNIYYNYYNEGKELQVTFLSSEIFYQKNAYVGNVVIPEEVTYMNRTRKVTSIGSDAFKYSSLTSVTIPNSVTSIGSYAFESCYSLTSVTIPNSVTSIGSYAFESCYSLTSVTIPNSVTSIGDGAFQGCHGLTSVTISDITAWLSISFADSESNPLYYAHHLFLNGEEVKDLTIPNSVTSIGNGTFSGCSSLTSITIGNGVTSIGGNAFSYCSSLTSVTIPNSVTSIGGYAFQRCSSLTSVTIGNSVTTIGYSAFSDCSSLTSVTIPNSVTSIGYYAFSDCSSLTSVTIPNSVTSIGDYAFYGCSSLTSIISKMMNPCKIPSNCFTKDHYYNSTLYIPEGTTEKYKTTDFWSNFLFVEEGDPSGGDSPEPEPQKCSKPIIRYKNGQLTFDCATEGATCYYSITDSDIKSGNGEKVDLTVTYHVSVYAVKQGCYNSDEATATLCWIDVDPKAEGIENGVANVKAMPVLIQGEEGVLHISGAPEGTAINVYEIGGQLVGFAKAYSDTTIIPTTLPQGSIAIVKIGEKAIKVLMK